MKRYSLNKNWEYVESGLQNPLLVNMLTGWKQTDLPHDYAMEKPRDPHVPHGMDEGYTQSAGLYYKKAFAVEESIIGKRFFLEFEGVAGVTEVWVNNTFVCKHMNPYTSFCSEVTHLIRAGENTVMVHTDNGKKPDSRWYVGCGIYRSVWMHVAEAVCILPGTLHVSAKGISGNVATLEISAQVSGACDSITYELINKEGAVVATSTGSEMKVENPFLWSVEDPHLYTLRATVGDDITEIKTGIRTVSVDPKNGFRLNGKTLKLKGGCIHHDLGLLGAASWEAAERRRIRLLKASGFNAIRLAHNPFGPDLFNICDEEGMLVIEEAFDEWVMGRTSFGLHITFEDRWERDLEDMVNRDYNHPCIVMWSTGNEVEERDGSADGYAWSRRLAEKVKALDPSRPVSCTACSLFVEYTQRPQGEAGTTGNQALNMAYDNFASGVDLWGDATAEYFAPVDVAGYNYKVVRYAHDGRKFPNRVIYGSESYPRAAFDSWQGVLDNDHVIGDFVWTAWDYIGEVGVGRFEVGDHQRPGNPAYPWLTAYCSDIDLIGQKRPQSDYRDVLWGVDTSPKLFCLSPELTGKNLARLSWCWLPVEKSYSFPGRENQPMEAYVYADAEEVELLQNGVSLGRKPCTKVEEYIACFPISYVPCKLEVIAFRDGQEIGRDMLVTCGKTEKLILRPDRPVISGDGKDLCFVTVQAADADSNPVPYEDSKVSVEVLGGKLMAFGSADPKPDREVPFQQATCPMYQGKVMAIIRSEQGGKGCLVKAKIGDISAELGIGFAPVAEENAPIHEVVAGAESLTLGELLDNPNTNAVLQHVMGAMLNNPMLGSMRGMSLKKLMSMGGQTLPAVLVQALNEAYKK